MILLGLEPFSYLINFKVRTVTYEVICDYTFFSSVFLYICSLIHSFSKYLFSTYYVLETHVQRIQQ